MQRNTHRFRAVLLAVAVSCGISGNIAIAQQPSPTPTTVSSTTSQTTATTTKSTTQTSSPAPGSCKESLNGSPVVDRKEGTHEFQVEESRFWVAQGNAYVVLENFTNWYNTAIAGLGKPQDDWSWTRPVNSPYDPTKCSNHSSGHAIDLNSRNDSIHTSPLSATNIVKTRTKIADMEGKVLWGGYYINPQEAFHFEYNTKLTAKP